MQRSSEVEGLVRQWYDAMTRGDTSAVTTLVSRESGVLGIGTDPQEWWTGHDKLVDVFRAQLAEMGGQLPITPGDLQGFAEGTVGWVADRPTFRLADGTSFGARLTGVFRQESGSWRCVQFHLSIGVPNEDSVGRELTV